MAVTGRDTRPACPGCETPLAIEDTETYACYQCLRRFDRDGPGRRGGEQ